MDSLVYNKTKIVATVGPASNSKEALKDLILAGVDVFRLNFSHGKHEDHLKVIKYVRELNEQLGSSIALLQDLQGPKIRINEVEPGVVIETGDKITITTEEVVGNRERVSTSYHRLPDDVKADDIILVDDGKVELKVLEVHPKEIRCEVLLGGAIKSRKGINLPFSNVSAPSLTEKDLKDLEFGLANKVDWVALSFVRKPTDIEILRDIINRNKASTMIIAKIEKPEAVKNIDDIIAVTDGLMIARGDLGVETRMEEVPMLQKLMIEKCNQAAKPVIVATQMLESMIESPKPTRAETNDVANAVIDGADALMLSAETATGKYPLHVIKSMERTIQSVEKMGHVFYRYRDVESGTNNSLIDGLILSACKLAEEVKAKAIVGMTQMGYNVYRAASHRPNANIFGFTGNRSVINAMSLVWGTRALFYDSSTSTDETIFDVEAALKEMGVLKTGDCFVFLASMPIQHRGRTNMIKVHYIK